jgi:hypothetical protein
MDTLLDDWGSARICLPLEEVIELIRCVVAVKAKIAGLTRADALAA